MPPCIFTSRKVSKPMQTMTYQKITSIMMPLSVTSETARIAHLTAQRIAAEDCAAAANARLEEREKSRQFWLRAFLLQMLSFFLLGCVAFAAWRS